MASYRGYRDLRVYQVSFALAKDIFAVTKRFPRQERFTLTDQIVRASRSVPANIAEGWKKRRYAKMFVSKMIDAAGEAGETEVWLDFALECGYISELSHDELMVRVDQIGAMLDSMANQPEKFCH